MGRRVCRCRPERGAQVALIEKEVVTSFPIVDLRTERLTKHFGMSRRARRVENTVQALQQVAGFGRRGPDVPLIGITGSVGKSTTKELIAEVLGLSVTAP